MPHTTPVRILVADDQVDILDAFRLLLSDEGYEVVAARSPGEALERLEGHDFDVAILDLNYTRDTTSGQEGLDLMERIRVLDPTLPVLLVTAWSSVAGAVEAMRRGARDYIEKPWDDERLLVTVRTQVELRRALRRSQRLQEANTRLQRGGTPAFIGDSPAIRQVRQTIERVAASDAAVLITGEHGTGKEVVATWLHALSDRKTRALVTMNAGGLAEGIAESELFGHVKGAFTGAAFSKKGLFELADKGTIFFDEIGNIPLETQAKLLRVIQEREFMRLGGVETIKVDVRIIAATNVDLRRMTEDGRFREDLYYRLHVITVPLPPLRERRDDIPLLTQHFLEKYGEENHKPHLELTPEALDLLMDYDWPGNVRELENAIERAVVLSTGKRIDADLVPENVRSSKRFQMPQFVVPPQGISYKDAETAFQRGLIESALEQAGGVQKRAAELLQIKPTTLNEMIKRHDIRPRRKRGAAAESRPDAAGASDSDDVNDEEEEVGVD
jgi:DNA-binding NtrC family response regulator